MDICKDRIRKRPKVTHFGSLHYICNAFKYHRMICEWPTDIFQFPTYFFKISNYKQM